MIVAESVVINNKQFTKTYSDENKYIECDGVKYSEAFDLAEIVKVYIETNITIENEEGATV